VGSGLAGGRSSRSRRLARSAPAARFAQTATGLQCTAHNPGRRNDGAGALVTNAAAACTQNMRHSSRTGRTAVRATLLLGRSYLKCAGQRVIPPGLSRLNEYTSPDAFRLPNSIARRQNQTYPFCVSACFGAPRAASANTCAPIASRSVPRWTVTSRHTEALKIQLPLGPGDTVANGTNHVLRKHPFHLCQALGFPGPTTSDRQDLPNKSAPGPSGFDFFQSLRLPKLKLAVGRTASCRPTLVHRNGSQVRLPGCDRRADRRAITSPEITSSTRRFCSGPAPCHWKQPAEFLPKPFAVTEVVAIPCCVR